MSKTESVPAVNTTTSYDLTLINLMAGYNYSMEIVAVQSIEEDTEISKATNQTGVTGMCLQ